jgi:hypothetical protein
MMRRLVPELAVLGCRDSNLAVPDFGLGMGLAFAHRTFTTDCSLRRIATHGIRKNLAVAVACTRYIAIMVLQWRSNQH